MKTYIKLVMLFLFFVVLQATHTNASDQGTSIAMESLDIKTLATGRPSKINVWFPQGQCSNHNNEPTEKQFCLADTANTSKVIVFSHGAMGSVLEYTWVGESLAAAGFIVVGVNHYGESWVYGQDAVNFNAAGFIWQRAQDVSAVLDYLSAHNIFQKKVNWENAIAIGHSSGGQTVAMLAGATFDLKLLTTYCNSTNSEGDHSCGYAKASANAPESFQQLFSSSQKDSRVKMIVMLDPALGSAVNTESLHTLNLPTLVVGATNNDFLLWKYHGLHYASEIPQAQTNLLTAQEGHFVFINPCNNNIKVMGVPLCEDRPGVDRKATQENIAKALIEFVRSENSITKITNANTPYHKPFNANENYSNGNNNQTMFMLSAIITNTPLWVFGLLALLTVFGLMQTRTRQVPIRVALIMPVAMLCLSISGILSTIGWQFSALSVWLLGIATVTFTYVKLCSENLATYDVVAKKLNIRGSFAPLFIILTIFLTRYILAVVIAMKLEIMNSLYFPLTMSFILGASSGFFLARGILYLQLKITQ